MNCLTAFLFAVTICLVSGESCTFNAQCNSTTCGSDINSVICQHPDGDGIVEGNGLCTCSSQVECTMREDCYSLTTLNCQATQRHCYDNRCICDRFPIG